MMPLFRSSVFVLLVLGLLAQTTAAQHCKGDLSPEGIDSYLSCMSSPLSGLGQDFWDAGMKHDVDPRLLVALAGAESSFGKAICTPFNAWNWSYSGICSSPFDSWKHGMDVVAEGVRRIYLNGGKGTIQTMSNGKRPSYCGKGCGFWEINVTTFYSDLGGDPRTTDLGFPTGQNPLIASTGIRPPAPRRPPVVRELIPPARVLLNLPAQPSSPSAQPDPDGIRIVWKDYSTDEDAFQVYRKGADSGHAWRYIGSTPANVTTFVDRDAACGSAYYYGIGAINEAGESTRAGWRVVLTPACSFPQENVVGSGNN